jgi:hypothetical protein
VNVSHDEPPRCEALHGATDRSCEGSVVAGEPLDDAGAVGIRLQAAEAPEAGVAEGAVVQIHGVLCGDDDAHAEGAGLFHESNEGALGGRVGGMGRKEAVDFVEDAESSEALATGKGSRPGEHLFEENTEDEGTLLVVQMGDADDDGAGGTRVA